MAAEMGEVLTSIPTEMALRQAEIGAMRTLNDSVNRLADRIDGFATDLAQIKDTVTEIKARNFDQQIAKLEQEAKQEVDRVERGFRREIDAIVLSATNSDTRTRAVEQAVARLGLGMAIVGTIGGAALGVVATKVFGG